MASSTTLCKHADVVSLLLFLEQLFNDILTFIPLGNLIGVTDGLGAIGGCDYDSDRLGGSAIDVFQQAAGVDRPF